MEDRVMIFAPVPRITVTIEQPSHEAELHVHAGGQGIWQARMVALLGVPVTLCGYVGGEVGRLLRPLLAGEGLTVKALERPGSSGWYVHDRRGGERATIAEASAVPLSRHEVDELYGLALAEGLRSRVTILSGPENPSVAPPDMYRRLAADLRAHDRLVVADLIGSYVRAVLNGGVSFLKMAHDEAVHDGWAAQDIETELIGALWKLHAAGADAVFISRAERPSLALLDEEVVEVRSPRLEVTDARGAGDSLTAAVAAVLAKGGSLTEAVRTGAAAGAVNVTRHGLGTGHAEVISELLGRVSLHSWPGRDPSAGRPERSREATVATTFDLPRRAV
jgi:1-phosphofructokinase